MSEKIFSFDAETNGLWGQAFAIGAIVYQGGAEVARFVGRCPIEGVVNGWVAENVIPEMVGIQETASSYEELLAAFAEFYLANKSDAEMVVHMGVPVESTVLKDMHSKGMIGDWDGPYPLHDVAGYLAQAGEDPTSVDDYMAKYALAISKDYDGGTHNPLYDSEVAARVFIHLCGRIV